MLMRAQGRSAWRRFTSAVQEVRPPAREVADGVLIIFGGALLLTPGFISDFFGLLFLLPPTRALIRRVFLRQVMTRITVSLAGARVPGGPPGGRSDRAVSSVCAMLETLRARLHLHKLTSLNEVTRCRARLLHQVNGALV